jgi:hypothetical protein
VAVGGVSETQINHATAIQGLQPLEETKGGTALSDQKVVSLDQKITRIFVRLCPFIA